MSEAVSAVAWLLESDEPGIVAQAKRDLLDEPAPAEAGRVLEGPKVRTLLSGQKVRRWFRRSPVPEVGRSALAPRLARRARDPGTASGADSRRRRRSSPG